MKRKASTTLSSAVKKSHHKAQRTTLACLNCRKKKIKCSGQYPCINCLNYKCECTYPSNGRNQPESTRQLSPNILKLIENLQKVNEDQNNNLLLNQINSLNEFLESKIPENEKNLEEFSTLSKESFHEDSAFHTRFSKNPPHKKIVDEYFGLFSCSSLLSFGGRNWFAQRCSDLYDESLKESVLKKSNNAFVTINRILFDEMNFWKEILPIKALDDMIGQKLNAAFIYELIQQNYETIMSRHNESFKSLVSKELLQNIHTQFFEDRINALNKPNILIYLCFLLEICLSQKNSLAEILKVLLKCCISVIKVFSYSFTEFNSLSGILYFLKLIDARNASGCYFSMLAHSIDLVQRCGLFRMEYYIGLKETEAEYKRCIFWDLYCLDKLNYLFDGRYISMLEDDKITCFFPNGVQEIKVLIDKGQFILKNDNLLNYLRFYEIRLCQFISTIFRKFSKASTQINFKHKNELVQEFNDLKDSILIDIRPGYKINQRRFNFSQRQIAKIKELHVKYFVTLSFITINSQVEKVSSTGMASDTFSGLDADCCLNVLEVIQEVDVEDETTLNNSLSKFGLLSFFFGVEWILRTPQTHKQTIRVVESLINFHLRVISIVQDDLNFHGSYFKVSNGIMTYMVDAIIKISKKQTSGDESLAELLEKYEFVKGVTDAQNTANQQTVGQQIVQAQASDNAQYLEHGVHQDDGIFNLNSDLATSEHIFLFDRDWRFDLFNGF